jgi:hypothetical protein
MRATIKKKQQKSKGFFGMSCFSSGNDTVNPTKVVN